MKAVAAVLFALVLGVAAVTPALADNITLSPGASINHNSATGGAGGAGGNASSAASANGGTHVQTNTQLNTQVNTQVTTQGQQQGQGQHQGQIQGQGQGQKQQANNEGIKIETDVPRMAPPAVAPSLAVSSLTCYGSWGIGLSSPFGGVSGGGPVKDKDCERARNALIYVNLGLRDVALALMAQNEDNARAMEAAGVKYPGQKVAVVEPTPEKVSAVSETAKTIRPVVAVDHTDIPSAMRATLAQRVESVQGN